jgi:ribonucleotide monophosphatase NagD (HAD superfamily)
MLTRDNKNIGRSSEYDVFVLDGFGTLYDKDFIPLPGANELLRLIGGSSLLFSNVGSMTGDQLKDKMMVNFSYTPFKVLTSLDLLLQFLLKEKIQEVYHYGGLFAEKELKKYVDIVKNVKSPVDAIVFTSLPGGDWIKKSQDILRYIDQHKKVDLILANPDRMLPGEHVGVNVGMMFDMLTRDWIKNENFILSTTEIGKPNLSRIELEILKDLRVLVIGDNFITDGGVADFINADFAHISSSNLKYKKKNRYYVFQNIEAFIRDFLAHTIK